MTGRSQWNEVQIERLRNHVASGGSLIRAAAMFRLTTNQMRVKARELGCPFPTLRENRAKLNAAMVSRADYADE